MFNRKYLMQLPIKKAPKFSGAEAFLTAEIFENILIINIYKTENIFVRIFIDNKLDWQNYYPQSRKWDKKAITYINLETHKYYYNNTIDKWNTKEDEKSKEIIKNFYKFIGCKADSAINVISNVQTKFLCNVGYEKQSTAAAKRKLAVKNVKWHNKANKEIEKSLIAKNVTKMTAWTEWPKNVISGQREPEKKGYCPKCKAVIMPELMKKGKAYCPICGEEYTCIDVTDIKGKHIDVNNNCTYISKSTGKKAIAEVFMYNRSITFNAVGRGRNRTYKVNDYENIMPIERYVFTENGNFGYKRWQNDCFRRIYTTDFTAVDKIYNRSCYYADTKIIKDLKGTVLENAHLNELCNLLNVKAHIEIRFADIYTKNPNIENLLVNGFEKIVLEKIYGNKFYNTLKLKNAKPADILELNKDEQKRCKEEKWNLEMLHTYKKMRDCGIMCSKNKLVAIINLKKINIEIDKEAKPIKAMNYFEKNCNKINLWLDYIKMAEANGENIQDEKLRYPQDITYMHDQEVKKTKWRTTKAYEQGFAELAKAYKPLTYNDKEYCIRIASCENELIVEGKLLDHCVGRYGGEHIKGNCIFFVRKKNEPDVPLYTLQVDVKTGTQLQLHGYKNEQSGSKIDEKAKVFINKWLTEIFVPYDFTNKQLKKSKLKKTA